MKRVIVLAMHGVPANDTPPDLLAEFMSLHHHAGHAHDRSASERLHHLEAQVRGWPRTAQNDPYHAASLDLGRALQNELGAMVVVAFNEFCDPDVETALHQAADRRPDEIVVVTPMLTPGGDHAERDIPAAIERARAAHPAMRIVYAWPIPLPATARFLADHVRLAVAEPPRTTISGSD